MKRTQITIAILITTFALLIFSCKPLQKNITAQLIFTQGDVTIIQNDVNKPAALGAIVSPDDIIATGNQSVAVLQIGDGAIAHIGSNSRVIVKSLLETSVNLYLEKGEVISKVERLKKGQEYMVKTRSVVASVRGTQFLVRADEKIGKVAVHTGSVSVKPVVEAEKEEVVAKETIVEQGKAAIVTVEETKDVKQPPVEIQEISVKDKVKIEMVAKIEVVPMEEVKKPETLEKIQETIKQNVEKIEKIDTMTDDEVKQRIKKERIERLIQQKTRTLEEIKEACERIDVVKLYSGKEIQGAIIGRENKYKILTTTGVVEVDKRQVRSVSVMR